MKENKRCRQLFQKGICTIILPVLAISIAGCSDSAKNNSNGLNEVNDGIKTEGLYTIQTDKEDEEEWLFTETKNTEQDACSNTVSDTIGENGLYVYNQLLDAGYTSIGASGLCGYLYAENRFQTTESGDQESLGIAMWRGERRKNLESYASECGMDVASLELQTAFLIKELDDNAEYYRTEEIKAGTDLTTVTDEVSYYFGGCARFGSYLEYENSRFAPGEKQYIPWDRFAWSDTMQCYMLDLSAGRSGGKRMLRAVEDSLDREVNVASEGK